MASLPTITGPDVDLAHEAAQRVVETHRRLVEFLRIGQQIPRIDEFVAQTLSDLGARSCFLGYRAGRLPPFPSHACLSVNDCIVHGTAGTHREPLTHGDILKIDIGVRYKGWIGDAAWTYAFGEPVPEARRLMDAGKESLRRGVEQLRPGNTFLEWAKAVHHHAEAESGFHLVRGLGGHGYGKKLHAPPFVSNVPPANPLRPVEWPDAHTPCMPGVLVAVEPMLAVGTPMTVQRRREWPIYTADGSLSVHYEHDVYIREDGPLVLTQGLDELPDVIEREA